MSMSQGDSSGWAVGWISFAGFMMILLGAFHAIAGLVGIIDDTFYVSGARSTSSSSTGRPGGGST